MNLLKFSSIGLAVFYVSYFMFLHVLPYFYVFDPAELKKICNEAIAENNGNTTELLMDITKRLQEAYPSYVNDYRKEDWFFNNAGGAMGSMIILHASITEYLIFFGSAVGTEGHSGVHFANDYFTIIAGEQRAFLPGELEPEIYKPGDQHLMKAFYSKQYKLPEEAWALELAQGWVPSMLPFGLLDFVFSTWDVYTFYKTAYITGKNMIWNLLRGKF